MSSAIYVELLRGPRKGEIGRLCRTSGSSMTIIMDDGGIVTCYSDSARIVHIPAQQRPTPRRTWWP